MKVIVDANIVFSGILNTKGKIGDLLINSSGLIQFIAPDFLRIEIRKHYNRLIKISKLSHDQIVDSEFQICRDILFISEEQIFSKNWLLAFDLVKDVDEKDVHYIAFSRQFGHKIWSGDKQLIRGLNKKGFTKFIGTKELYRLRQKKIEKG